MIKLARILGQDKTPETPILVTYEGGANDKSEGVSEDTKKKYTRGDEHAD